MEALDPSNKHAKYNYFTSDTYVDQKLQARFPPYRYRNEESCLVIGRVNFEPLKEHLPQ